MNIDKQIDQAFRDVFLAASAVALAVIFYKGYISTAEAKETIVEVPMQSTIIKCDTDLDCMLKNPNTNLIEERSKGNEY